MTVIRAAHHFGLTVKDIERSRTFYTEVLGFVEVFTWNPRADYIGTLVGHPDVDLHASILRMPETDICLELLEYRGVPHLSVPHDNSNPGTAHLAFFVDDLDEVFADWTRRGVGHVSLPVTPTMGPNRGGKAVYMIDPDGFRVELIQSVQSFHDFGAEE